MSTVINNARIVWQNNINFIDQDKIGQITCSPLVQALGTEWFQPVVANGILQGYNRLIQSAKPSVDSFKTIRIRDNNQGFDIWIAINDDDDITAYTNKCNGCCGAVPEMEDVIIPAPIVEFFPCPTVEPGDETFTFLATFPGNLNDLNFSFLDSYNGDYQLPEVPAAGFADEAALLAWLQDGANDRDTKGTWSIVTPVTGPKQLKLVSTTVESAGLVIGLVPKVYCLEIPDPAEDINSITIGGVEVPFPTVSLGQANPQAALLRISDYLEGELVLFDPTHYQYTGLQVPQTLDMDSVTVATWTVGACV